MGTYTSKYTGQEIDNLLGQVENGRGSGSGYSETVLFEGVCGATSFTKVDQTITLSQSIKEFDMIGFYQICLYTSNNYKRPKYVEVPADMLIDNFENETNSANRISFVLGYKDEPAYWDMAIDSTDTKLVTMSSGAYVTKIVGIKY